MTLRAAVRRVSLRCIPLLAPLALAACAQAGMPAPAPGASPREGYLAGAGGVRLFYRVVGVGPDTVVVVHGGPGVGAGTVAPDLEPLERRHVVIYYDQRGGGRSGLPADSALLHARYFVEDLEAVRRHFGLETMNLLAASFGPVLAAKYAETHPERVRRMVFVGAIGPRRADANAYGQAMYGRMDPATRDSMIALVRQLVTGTAPDVAAACRAYERLARKDAAARGEPGGGRGSACDAPPEAVAYGYRMTARHTVASFGEWDFTRALGAVRAPLLVVFGDRDPSPVASQWAWAAAVLEGRLLVIPGAGHGPHISRPDLFFPAVDAFLAGRWPEGAQPPPR